VVPTFSSTTTLDIQHNKAFPKRGTAFMLREAMHIFPVVESDRLFYMTEGKKLTIIAKN